MTATEAHARIELQSPSDLTYLLATAHRAAREKLLASTSTSASGSVAEPSAHTNTSTSTSTEPNLTSTEPNLTNINTTTTGNVDPSRLAPLLAAYVDRTFDLAKANIAVNGIPAQELAWADSTAPSSSARDASGSAARDGPEEFETYDTELAAKIQALQGRIEEMNWELAKTRRTAAAAAVRSFEEEVAAGDRREEEEWERRRAEVGGAGREEGGDAAGESMLMLLPWAERAQRVQRTWELALGQLGELEPLYGLTRRRAEEAQKVVDYFEGKS